MRSHFAGKRLFIALTLLFISPASFVSNRACGQGRQNRYATSDSQSPYVHWIDLYDAQNSKIDPASDNPKPYSPAKTCGRCHDLDQISHGWHFNAVTSEKHGRPGQPWIWNDPRTGTYLPLSYRGWDGTWNPDDLSISRWQVAAKLGGFMPGGGVGAAESFEENGSQDTEDSASSSKIDRSNITGELPVDCLMCHHNTGSGYSPFTWTEQIEDENFAFAPTAALGIGTVSGNMRRLKDDFDPSTEEGTEKMPKVTYERSRFRSDGKVFIDLVRKPKNDACYYCHTNTPADVASGNRWLHDEDVHLRAGMACVDCHRNGLDHHTVRGYENEVHPSTRLAASFSCQGCHLGEEHAPTSDLAMKLPGRLGAPKPQHKGLPPLHFDTMTCTACHSGPLPGSKATRQINSVAHRLGAHVKRTGDEAPALFAGVNLKSSAFDEIAEQQTGAHKKYAPHRMYWPSYWGIIDQDKVVPLNPEAVYELIRKPLKVRRDFTEELSEVKLKLSQRKELLGEERARAREEDRTKEEQQIIENAEAEQRAIQVSERMSASLAALEEAYKGKQAVYVSAGQGFVRGGEGEITKLESGKLGEAADPYAWPLAHNVRPARQALGATGCLECHSSESPFFQMEITPVSLLPDQGADSVVAHELQHAEMVRLDLWSQMFAGRSSFKLAGLVALGVTCLIALTAAAYNLGSRSGEKGGN